MRRLLTIGHSYTVGVNRRLAHEMALAGKNRWEVTCAAPRFVIGDLRPIELEAIDEEACHLEPVSLRMTSRPHFMTYARDAKRLVTSGAWDLIHAWEEPYIPAGWQISRWAKKIAPFVFYTYQNISKRYPPPFNWLENETLRNSTAWIAGGHTVEDAMMSRSGYADHPHARISLGVDTNLFQPYTERGNRILSSLNWSASGPPIIGFLGRFILDKGVNLLMKALDGLQTGWRALFVGGGVLERKLRHWGSQYGDRVRIVTGITHTQVPDYLNAMDILAAPSQTTPRWKEQLGRMLIEGFASGLPVVGSNSGEIPSVLGDCGLVVEESSDSAWKKTLGELIENASYRNELGEKGRDRAITHFSWPVIAKRNIDFFDQLLDSPIPKH